MVDPVTVRVCLCGNPVDSVEVDVNIVKCDSQLPVETVFSALCERIGLTESARQHFTLAEGVTVPVRVFRASDHIPVPLPELSLIKWLYDGQKEQKLCTDPVALTLVYKQAQSDIERGLLEVDSALKKQLEECQDTDFLAEGQFVQLCRRMRFYEAYTFQHCSLVEEFQFHDLKALQDTQLTLRLLRKGLSFSAAKDKKSHFVPWWAVECWSHDSSSNSVTFDIHFCGSKSELHLSTLQSSLMLAVILKVIHTLLKDKSSEGSVYHASDVNRCGSKMSWKNILFDPGVQNPVFEDNCTDDGYMEF